MNALEQGFQSDAKHLVIIGTAETALGPKLHILYPARWTGQSRQLVRQLTDVLPDERLQDRRQIEIRGLKQLLLFRTILAEVQLFFVSLDDVREVHSRRSGARLALHGINSPRVFES